MSFSMKKFACGMICVCLILNLSACSRETSSTESAGSENTSTSETVGSSTIPTAETTATEKTSTTESIDPNTVDQKYVPRFMDIESGKSAVKPLIFGSNGWSLRYRSHYLFAVYGQYILRYDMATNKIDML